MLLMMCVSDEVELAVLNCVDPCDQVTVRSFRLEEQERETLSPSKTDIVPLGLSIGGLKTEKQQNRTKKKQS